MRYVLTSIYFSLTEMSRYLCGLLVRDVVCLGCTVVCPPQKNTQNGIATC